jgi:hypothetical protein
MFDSKMKPGLDNEALLPVYGLRKGQGPDSDVNSNLNMPIYLGLFVLQEMKRWDLCCLL